MVIYYTKELQYLQYFCHNSSSVKGVAGIQSYFPVQQNAWSLLFVEWKRNPSKPVSHFTNEHKVTGLRFEFSTFKKFVRLTNKVDLFSQG